MRFGDGIHRRCNFITTRLRRISATVLEGLLPAICCGCGRLYPLPRHTSLGPVDPTFTALVGQYMCTACAGQFTAIQAPMCSLCGQPFATPHGPDHLCGQCLDHPFHFQAARAAGLYEGAMRSAIHHLKYQRRDQLSVPLGRLLWQACKQYWNPGDFDRIVPVPLHPRRLRERGFNQAGLLIRQWPALAVRDGLKTAPDWIDSRILRRHRPTQPQTGLKREQRVSNLRQAFCIDRNRTVHGQRILLVDDVMTTGTTADICARTLLSAGAAEVRVLTLARAVL